MRQAIEKYLADLAAYKERQLAEIERIRAQLGDPQWQPHGGPGALALSNVGAPPENPFTKHMEKRNV